MTNFLHSIDNRRNICHLSWKEWKRPHAMMATMLTPILIIMKMVVMEMRMIINIPHYNVNKEGLNWIRLQTGWCSMRGNIYCCYVLLWKYSFIISLCFDPSLGIYNFPIAKTLICATIPGQYESLGIASIAWSFYSSQNLPTRDLLTGCSLSS